MESPGKWDIVVLDTVKNVRVEAAVKSVFIFRESVRCRETPSLILLTTGNDQHVCCWVMLSMLQNCAPTP